MSDKKIKFQEVETRVNWFVMNENIIKFWQDNKIFEKSVKQRDDQNAYVFYDGPPFVTGIPHYGSLLPSIAKDLIPRYQTMKGKRVERVWGWDCHGLPIENKVEEKLGLKSRRDIEKIGLDKFIPECRAYVSQTSSQWKWYINHIGRWVDFDHSYKTMDQTFMESVWWVFKQIYDKDLIYKGKRVSLYCTHCGTPISNFEVAMDNSYKDITEDSTTYKFKLTDKSRDALQCVSTDKVFFLAWSTTPWNKIVTTALGINPKLTYILIKQNEEFYILAKETTKVLKGEFEIVKEFKGKELLGLTYEPLYDIMPVPEGKKAWIVIAGDFVSSDEGTGIVTLAAYGEDDFKVMKENNVWLWEHLDGEGKIILDYPLFKDVFYLKANKLVDEDLAKRGLIYRQDSFTHSVPLCWRCATRLIYAPQDAWFLRVSQVKEKLLQTNEAIYWFPKHIKHGRFQKGIESAPDWCVSRSRYWATPLPIWECDNKLKSQNSKVKTNNTKNCNHRVVIGSIDEIEKLTGKKVTDLHRPYIDEFVFPCEKCDGTMRRVADVVDCWLESGSMPYGQRHYPFENKEAFEANFPADFIVEYIAQTRAWFYVMHVISNCLFGTNCFKNVICTGVVKGTDGRKMSKSYGNYPDPQKVIETYGADALRLYLMSSPVMSGENLNIDENEIKEQNQRVLSILWNSYKYFVTYANLHNFGPFQDVKLSENVLDQWILLRLEEVKAETTRYLDEYNIPKATRLIRDFVSDLSNWYIRESRNRFVDGDLQALQTLYKVLLDLSLVFAPTIPFITEEIYQNLNAGNKESVHLCDWLPSRKLTKEEKQLLSVMEEVRKICTLGNAIRKEKQIPTRQPLAEARITIKNSLKALFDKKLEQIILDELNVVKISWISHEEAETAVEYDETITPELKAEGDARQIVRKIQEARKKAGTALDAKVIVILPDWPENKAETIKQRAGVKELRKGEKLEILSE
ncbi:isoleucine--tRNA ligase [Candidatus Beckwithbacteria bacterium]|nr:isoleucine--tRNA ligase [Candidatus Beckwithbacteria bacterium]